MVEFSLPDLVPDFIVKALADPHVSNHTGVAPLLVALLSIGIPLGSVLTIVGAMGTFIRFSDA